MQVFFRIEHKRLLRASVVCKVMLKATVPYAVCIFVFSVD